MGLFLENWNLLKEKLEDPFFQELHSRNEQALQALRKAVKGSLLDHMPLSLNDPASTPENVHPHLIRGRLAKIWLLRSAVSWHLTGSQESLSHALEIVDELLKPEVWAGDNQLFDLKHADLTTADTWYCAVFALDSLEGSLSDSQQKGLYRLLTEWALPAYLRGYREGEWWRHAEFNWGSSLHGNAGLSALAVRHLYPELAEEVLTYVGEGVEFIKEGFPIGGGWPEGLMYLTTAVAHLTDYLGVRERLGLGDHGFTQHQPALDTLDFRMHMLGGDGCPLNFSNCEENTPEWPLPHAYWWARQCQRPEWTWWEDAHQKDWRDLHGVFLDVEAFWWRAAHQPSQKPQLSALKHFQKIDWLTWHAEKSWLGFRSGFNGDNHNQFDLGHLIFGQGKDRLLIDPGYGYRNTSQHNAVTIRGQGQCDGARSSIYRVRSGKDHLYVACDLAECFPHVVAFQHRHVLALDGRFLLVVDDLLMKRGRRASADFYLQLHVEPQWEDTRLRVVVGETSFLIDILSPHMKPKISSWESNTGVVWTVKWRQSPDVPTARQAFLLDLAGDPYRYEESGQMSHLVYGDKTWGIDLAEGLLNPLPKVKAG